MGPGAIFVDHTTASADVARELYALARGQGLQFVDAPVSGGQAGAVNGVLTVMSGGEPQAFEAIKPIAQAYGRAEIGRAHVRTPVTNAQLVCRLMLENNKIHCAHTYIKHLALRS